MTTAGAARRVRGAIGDLVLASLGVMVVRRDDRAVHDLVAGTSVVPARAAGASDSGPSDVTT